MVLLILGCFSLCWFPYFFVLTYMRLYNGRSLPEVYEAVFTLAVSNSWMNPLIYAWKSKNYRNAFWCLLKCKSPRNLNKEPNFITDHIPGDKSRKNNNAAERSSDNNLRIEIQLQEDFKQAKNGKNLDKQQEEMQHSDGTVTTCIN